MLINSQLRNMGPLPNKWSQKTGSFGLFCPNVPICNLQESTLRFEIFQPSWADPVWTPRTVQFGTAIFAMFPKKWPQMGQVSAQTEHCVCNLVVVSWLQTTETSKCEHMLKRDGPKYGTGMVSTGNKAFPSQHGLGLFWPSGIRMLSLQSSPVDCH